MNLPPANSVCTNCNPIKQVKLLHVNNLLGKLPIFPEKTNPSTFRTFCFLPDCLEYPDLSRFPGFPEKASAFNDVQTNS